MMKPHLHVGKVAVLMIILVLFARFSFAQNLTITGKVVDNTSQQPLVGATICIGD